MKPSPAILRWLLLGLLWLGMLAPGRAAASTAHQLSPSPEYLYTGEQIDPDLGMYYLRARYYQPATGRFWNMDSFEGYSETPLSLHKYLYCNGNPINGVDPSGHETLISINFGAVLQSSMQGFRVAAGGIRAGFSVGRVWLNSNKLRGYGIIATMGGLAVYEQFFAPGAAGFHTIDGKNHDIGYFAPATDLSELLADQNGGSIDVFAMTGHADERHFKVGRDQLVVFGSDGNYDLTDFDNNDILALLNSKMTPNGKVYLHGCSSSELARKVSTVVRGRTIIGYANPILGLNAVGINAPLTPFGKVQYVNGNRVN